MKTIIFDGKPVVIATPQRERTRPGPRSPVTPAMAREIRRVWAQWKAEDKPCDPNHPLRRGYGALGQLFGLSSWTVRGVVTGHTHVYS